MSTLLFSTAFLAGVIEKSSCRPTGRQELSPTLIAVTYRFRRNGTEVYTATDEIEGAAPANDNQDIDIFSHVDAPEVKKTLAT